ncbi:siphovirus Gp157 family protein [Janthinobacterium sp. B9-8]|uniref:siphovirus Gp157 family protein n=1 Tax=Janthinobacterium sp. B9-8 TaxID=1236179 RepID=UPI00061D0882|nr:siphovirus Gp157 family protein [Janthinobacterium sp. B9-8]AMC34776.1 hypothetical protein VN23_09215 [Janthinobacterium sp. B9-8]
MNREFLDAVQDLSAQLEAGDITQQIFDDTIEGLAFEPEQKALNVAKYIRSLEIEAEAIKVVEDARKSARESLQKKAASLREYLARELDASGLSPKDSEISVSTKRNPPSVLVDDFDKLDAEFVRVVPEKYEADKNKLKDALKAGREIDGARLERKLALTIK